MGKSANGKRTRSELDAEAFIKVWQGSESVGEVLKKIPDTTRVAVTSRAHFYRSKGIALKKFGRGSTLDIAKLKKVASESEK